MDMRGMGAAFTNMLPGAEARAEKKEMAIDAFHHHCFVNADSTDKDAIEDSVRGHYDQPDETAKAILRQAAFTVQDVLDHDDTIAVGSAKYENLVLLQTQSMEEDYLDYVSHRQDEPDGHAPG